VFSIDVAQFLVNRYKKSMCSCLIFLFLICSLIKSFKKFVLSNLFMVFWWIDVIWSCNCVCYMYWNQFWLVVQVVYEFIMNCVFLHNFPNISICWIDIIIYWIILVYLSDCLLSEINLLPLFSINWKCVFQ